MTVPILLTLAMMFAAWTFLSVLGDERQRRVRNRAPRQPVPPPSEATVGRQVAR